MYTFIIDFVFKEQHYIVRSCGTALRAIARAERAECRYPVNQRQMKFVSPEISTRPSCMHACMHED